MTLEDLMEAVQRVNLAAEQFLKTVVTDAKTKQVKQKVTALEDLMKIPIKEAVKDMCVGKVQAIADDEGKVLKIIVEYVPKERSY